MPAPDDQSHARVTPAHARGVDERGFTVVELTVAMAIIIVLAAAAMLAFGGSKGAVRGKEAVAVGASYAQAIAQFQADNANNNPTAAQMGSANRGPLNLLGKPYLGGTPEGVTAGRVAVTMTGTCSAPPNGSFTGAVTYCPEAAPAYGIRVNTRTNPSQAWTAGKVCWHGNTAQTPRC